MRIGIRREDKNEWERRVPLAPLDVEFLIREKNINVSLQPMPNRAFSDSEYEATGAEIDEKLAGCNVIFGIKEMPVEFFREGLTYVFFAHVIKGQPYNMPMLRRIMELGCNLIDYEKITDDDGRRLVLFGKEAGQAGMIDTLWALGQRLKSEGTDNPFETIKQAWQYRNLSEAEVEISVAGSRIDKDGIPESIHPVVFGFAGYGNVSNGAQGVLDQMPVKEISPFELINSDPDTFSDNRVIYKVVFHERDMVEPIDPEHVFELQDYYDNPLKYRGDFEKYIPHLTVLMNCIFWTEEYPRLFTKDFGVSLYKGKDPVKLRIIGDISSDLWGAVEITEKNTNPGNPVYVYDFDRNEMIDGFEGNGPVILAVDNLPSELPREASIKFSQSLAPLVPGIASADFSVSPENLQLAPEVRRGLIVYHGELTPDYHYISEFL